MYICTGFSFIEASYLQGESLANKIMSSVPYVCLAGLVNIGVYLSVDVLNSSRHAMNTLMNTLIARFMGPTWAHLGPAGPRWAPCWPHELCYLGTFTWFFDALKLKQLNGIAWASSSSPRWHSYFMKLHWWLSSIRWEVYLNWKWQNLSYNICYVPSQWWIIS